MREELLFLNLYTVHQVLITSELTKLSACQVRGLMEQRCQAESGDWHQVAAGQTTGGDGEWTSWSFQRGFGKGTW